MSRLRVRRLDPAARLPTRAYEGDAGLDLYAVEAAELGPGERAAVRTGIAVEIPPGQAGLVLPRSGLAARHGIALVNAPGLIDSGYRGELEVLLLNTDRSACFSVAAGDRIAQLVLVDVQAPEVLEAAELAGSQRGTGGFGSSGVAAAAADGEVSSARDDAARRDQAVVGEESAGHPGGRLA